MERNHDKDRIDRIVTEILDPVDVYSEGGGPEGPWYYRSLTVTRRMNRIFVDDVDGRSAATLHVQDLSDVEDPKERLKAKLDEIHETTLEQL